MDSEIGRIEGEIGKLVDQLNSDGDDEVSAEILNKFKTDISNLMDSQKQSLNNRVDDRIHQLQELFPGVNDNEIEYIEDDEGVIGEYVIRGNNSMASENEELEAIQFDIDTTEIDNLILESEKWRGYMFNLGYELNQLKKMRVLCSDATIKVRRLLKNFRDRIERTQESVWN